MERVGVAITRRHRPAIAAVVVIVALVIVAALLLPDLRRPVQAPVPAEPYPVTDHPTCRGTDGLPPEGTGRPWVDADPDGAVALWLPGLNTTAAR